MTLDRQISHYLKKHGRKLSGRNAHRVHTFHFVLYSHKTQLLAGCKPPIQSSDYSSAMVMPKTSINDRCLKSTRNKASRPCAGVLAFSIYCVYEDCNH